YYSPILESFSVPLRPGVETAKVKNTSMGPCDSSSVQLGPKLRFNWEVIATDKPPTSHLQAALKPGDWDVLSCVPLVFLLCCSCSPLVLPSFSRRAFGGAT